MGLSIATQFGENTFKIAMIARSGEKLANLKQELAEKGINSIEYPCDVSDFSALEKTLDQIYKENGPAEVLVHNVSILNQGSPSDFPLDQFVKDFKVNVGSALLAYQKVLPQMQGNESACIIITGGGLSTDPFHEFASLGVGKAGLRNLAMSMAQEGNKKGVRVHTITVKGMIKKGTFFDPDKISTEFWKAYSNPDTDSAEIVFEEES